MHAARRKRRCKLALGLLVAEQAARRPRVRGAVEAVGLGKFLDVLDRWCAGHF
jgi:hypothetical protein